MSWGTEKAMKKYKSIWMKSTKIASKTMARKAERVERMFKLVGAFQWIVMTLV